MSSSLAFHLNIELIMTSFEFFLSFSRTRKNIIEEIFARLGDHWLRKVSEIKILDDECRGKCLFPPFLRWWVSDEKLLSDVKWFWVAGDTNLDCIMPPQVDLFQLWVFNSFIKNDLDETNLQKVFDVILACGWKNSRGSWHTKNIASARQAFNKHLAMHKR